MRRPLRPGWVRVLAFLILLAAVSHFMQSLLALAQSPLVLGLALLLDALLAAAGVGLWQLKKWGAVCFLLAALASLIYFVLYTIVPGNAQPPASAFWCVLVGALAVYGLVIFGLRRLWLADGLD